MAHGFSLHVGLDRLDTITFPHTSLLSGCAAAAGLMATIATQQRFKPITTMTNGQATFAKVSKWWATTIRDTQPGDIVFFSFSGHGESVPISSGQPLAQTFALFDREVLDQELLDTLSRFKAGVRIVLVADSCFSGGLLDSGQTLGARAVRARRLSTFGADSLEATASSPADTKRVVGARAGNVAQISADVLLFAASPKDLKARAAPQGAPFSPFSGALKRVWDNHAGRFGRAGYRDLFADVKADSLDNEPVLVEDLVKTASFPTESPFTI